MEGEVLEALGSGMFRVALDNGHELIAYTAGKMKKNRIKTLAGDRVTVEKSANRTLIEMVDASQPWARRRAPTRSARRRTCSSSS